jgi:hypothetical protein
MERTKTMPAQNTVSLIATNVPQSYAAQVNARYNDSASNCIPLDQRYNDKIAALPTNNQTYYAVIKQNAIAEFRRLNPNINNWNDLTLAQSVYITLADIFIDTTMQRELSLDWVYKLLTKFKMTKVVPIQVYKDPETGHYCAWDGQHTAILLYIICVDILGLDPRTVKVPVNVYSSNLKAEIRECFTELNSSEGKAQLVDIDLWIQRVLGVRIDGSKNPIWVTTEKKQAIIEKFDLFVTNEKFNDTHMPGAISRLTEINKLDLDSLEWLCYYLHLVTINQRRVYEKEMVMMAHFFFRCRCDGVKVDQAYIANVAFANLTDFNADFTPNGMFWDKAKDAFHNWHNAQPFTANNGVFKKELVHGFPFLLAQLSKSVPGIKLPRNTSGSQFWPDAVDLF